MLKKIIVMFSFILSSTFTYADKPIPVSFPYGKHLVHFESGMFMWGTPVSNNSTWITVVYKTSQKLDGSSKYYNVHRTYFSASCGSQLIQDKDHIFYYAKHTEDLLGEKYPISSTYIDRITPPSYAVKSINVIPNTASESIYDLICYGSSIVNFNYFR